MSCTQQVDNGCKNCILLNKECSFAVLLQGSVVYINVNITASVTDIAVSKVPHAVHEVSLTDPEFPASSNLLCDKVPVPRETIEDTSCSSECVILGHETPNVAVIWLTLLVLIPEPPSSNLEAEPSYPYRGRNRETTSLCH